MLTITIIVALFFLLQINKMTFALCVTREIPEEKQPKLYQTVNVLIVLLMLSFYMQFEDSM